MIQVLEEKVLEEIKFLKSKGFIRNSKSSWHNNIVPVVKSNSMIRIAIILKQLNVLVNPDRYSLHRIEEIIYSLCDQSAFSKKDLKDKFFHILVRE